jgi:prepilin-type N-terminal cleavage/methylation domain-containing protein/prepilin-type processing-associated H-X9-DG protein
MRRLSPNGFTLIELLVVLAIITIVITLTIAGVQKVRAASARAVCINQLRQIGIALQHHHDVQSHFPAGVSYLDGKSPQPHMTWLTRILPFVEQEVLWKQSLDAFQQEKFFEKPPHTDILGRKIAKYVCPLDTLGQTPWNYGPFSVAYTSYLGVSGLNLHSWDGVLHTDANVRIAQVTDGTSQTLLVGERPTSSFRSFGWWYAGWGQAKTGSVDSILGVREMIEHIDLMQCPTGPYQFRQGQVENRCDLLRYWSLHSGGGHFAFCDGSVRFLKYSMNDLMPALATRSGNESLNLPE